MLNVADNRRWQLALVLMVTFFVAYLDRLNITFAVPLMAQEYGWSEEQTQSYGSLLMGIFYGAYGIANIFLTPFAARFGPRKSLLVVVTLWSLFTALGAWVSQWMMALIATRILLGAAEAVHVPMVSQLFKHWFPLEERARANSIFVAGLFLAVLLSPIMLVPLMSALGWQWGFVLIAFFGLLLSLPLVYFVVYNTPEEHPAISEQEKAFLLAGRQREEAVEADGLQWRDVIVMPTFLLLCVIGITNNIIALGVSSWLPTYFTSNRGVAFEDITLLVALPYVFSLLGIATWGYLGDKLNKRAVIGAFGSVAAGFAIYMGLNAENLYVVLGWFSLCMFTASAFNACEFALLQRIAPLSQAAHTMGMYNGLATLIGGGLGPAIVSPIISADGPVWIISALAVSNAVLLLTAYRILRY